MTNSELAVKLLIAAGYEAYRMLSYWLAAIPGRADVEIIVRKLK